MTQSRTLARAVPFALLLGLAACGGDDDEAASGETSGESSGDRDQYVEAIVEASGAEEGAAVSSEELRCTAEAVVDGVGVEKLSAAVSPDDIRQRRTSDLVALGVTVDEADGDRFYEAMGECGNLRALIARSASGVRDIPQETLDCLDQTVDDQLLKTVLVTTYTQGDGALDQNPELRGQLQSAFGACPAP